MCDAISKKVPTIEVDGREFLYGRKAIRIEERGRWHAPLLGDILHPVRLQTGWALGCLTSKKQPVEVKLVGRDGNLLSYCEGHSRIGLHFWMARQRPSLMPRGLVWFQCAAQPTWIRWAGDCVAVSLLLLLARTRADLVQTIREYYKNPHDVWQFQWELETCAKGYMAEYAKNLELHNLALYGDIGDLAMNAPEKVDGPGPWKATLRSRFSMI